MFGITLEEIKKFLKEFDLPVNEENIKWAYKIMLSEIKTLVKIKKFEKKYNESVFTVNINDNCCGDACDCKNGKSKKK